MFLLSSAYGLGPACRRNGSMASAFRLCVIASHAYAGGLVKKNPAGLCVITHSPAGFFWFSRMSFFQLLLSGFLASFR